MSTDNTQKLKDLFRSMFAADANTTAQDLVDEFFDKSFGWSVVKHPADAAASTALELPFAITNSSGGSIRVTTVKYLPAAALTASDTDYATLTLEYDDGAGGANTVVATANTQTTGTGNWTAQTPVTITITAANAKVAAGKQLIFKIAKTGSGVAVPAGTLFVEATATT